MFCSKCGKQAEGVFCWNCGAKLYKPEPELSKDKSTAVNDKTAKPEVCKRPVSFMKFRATRQYKNVKVQFDDVHQIVAVGSDRAVTDGESSVIYLRYSEIIGAEVKCNYASVSETSTSSMIGRAAVGSLFSSEAAVIGGATAKRTERLKVESLSLHITSSNIRYPLVCIPLDGVFLNEAELVCGVLQQAMLMPPSEEAFELTEKWGAGSAPLKADLAPKSVSKAERTVLEPWMCTECCYKNPASRSTCRNCSAPKSNTQNGSALSASAEVADGTSAQGTWFCSVCDYKNNGGRSCRSCGASRSKAEHEQTQKSGKLFGKIL